MYNCSGGNGEARFKSGASADGTGLSMRSKIVSSMSVGDSTIFLLEGYRQEIVTRAKVMLPVSD